MMSETKMAGGAALSHLAVPAGRRCFLAEPPIRGRQTDQRGASRVTSVCRAIFQAIHEGRWLSVAYKNQGGQVTRYWMAVRAFAPRSGQLIVDGLHLRVERIQSADLIEGSWCPVNERLVRDILENPRSYER